MTAPRLATRDDEVELLALCHELHRENGLQKMDDDMVREMLWRAFDRKGGVVGVIEGEDGIEAAICLLITSIWYSKDHHLVELFAFVRRPFRKSNHATALVEWADKAAKTLGIPLIVGILSNEKLEAKTRLYKRVLGVPSGVLFVRGATWSNTSTNPEVWKSMLKPDNYLAKGARPVSYETLRALGNGDAGRGWTTIQRFIQRKLERNVESDLMPAMATAVASAAQLSAFPMVN